MFHCKLKEKDCPHLRKVTRATKPKNLTDKSHGICLVCSKISSINNIVEIVEAFNCGSTVNTYHCATTCPLENN